MVIMANKMRRIVGGRLSSPLGCGLRDYNVYTVSVSLRGVSSQSVLVSGVDKQFTKICLIHKSISTATVAQAQRNLYEVITFPPNEPNPPARQERFVGVSVQYIGPMSLNIQVPIGSGSYQYQEHSITGYGDDRIVRSWIQASMPWSAYTFQFTRSEISALGASPCVTDRIAHNALGITVMLPGTGSLGTWLQAMGYEPYGFYNWGHSSMEDPMAKWRSLGSPVTPYIRIGRPIIGMAYILPQRFASIS